MKILRLIEWFDKETEIIVDEFDITNISLDSLIKVFKPSEEDPLMYYSYEIREKEAVELKKIIQFEFYFNEYDYFVSCYQDNRPT